MSKAILTSEGKERLKLELNNIITKQLPEAEEWVRIAQRHDANIQEATEIRDFYKSRIPYLENIIATATVMYGQTISIGQDQAKKLGEVMEMISDSGVDSITRNEAAEHCIDWVWGMVKKNGMKIRPKS